MIRRFASDLSVLILGGFVAVLSQRIDSDPMQWWLLAVGLMTLAAGAYGAYDTARGRNHRAVDMATGALGLWAVIASFAWSGGTLLDISLVTGIAFAVVGTVGLVIHELHTERVVHALEVSAPAGTRDELLVR